MSFDVWAGQLSHIEVYGTGGSLSVPDPNGFGEAVQNFRAGAEDWAPVAEAGGYRGATRGYGVSDLASALTTGTAHRADGEGAYHVLGMMEGRRQQDHEAAQSRPRNPSYGAATARAAGREKPSRSSPLCCSPNGSRCTWPTAEQTPGHEHLPCMTFDTQMPLYRRRHSVSYSKKAHNLDPPYGIEP